MKKQYSNNKIIHFAFSMINYDALLELVKKINSSEAIRIVATNIDWDDAYVDLCRKHQFKIERDRVFVSLISENDIRDSSLLQIMKVLHNMEPEELNISLYSDADFFNCICEIMIMYYEYTATICHNASLSRKELKQLSSKSFIL